MDRVIIYQSKRVKKAKLYLYGCSSYKEIKESIKKYSPIKILGVLKFKLCPCCKEGWLEVPDFRCKKLLS